MANNVETLGSLEPAPRSPIERFEDILAGLEPFLEGEPEKSFRSSSVLPTATGDALFSVYLPDTPSVYSKSITYQEVVKKNSAEAEYMAPVSEIHLKLRHLDSSLGISREEEIETAYGRLQALELAFANYEAAARIAGS